MWPDEQSPPVSTEWLERHQDGADLRIVDVRWRSRYEDGRGISFDDRDGYRAGHIPGAVNVPTIADMDPELANAALRRAAGCWRSSVSGANGCGYTSGRGRSGASIRTDP